MSLRRVEYIKKCMNDATHSSLVAPLVHWFLLKLDPRAPLLLRLSIFVQEPVLVTVDNLTVVAIFSVCRTWSLFG